MLRVIMLFTFSEKQIYSALHARKTKTVLIPDIRRYEERFEEEYRKFVSDTYFGISTPTISFISTTHAVGKSAAFISMIL